MSTAYTHSAPFRSLEEIRQRKDELRRQIDRDHQTMERLWQQLSIRREDTTQGQFIAALLSNSAVVIDAFLMVRKLRKNHSGLFQFFSRKKRST